MVIRGNLTGHAWRTYQSGQRKLCGISLPEGMNENDFFPAPIITPSTKASEGHDEDISKEDIIASGLASQSEWDTLENYTRKLFEKGTQIAASKGLILVDTKYEFGKHNGKIYLIDDLLIRSDPQADIRLYNVANPANMQLLSTASAVIGRCKWMRKPPGMPLNLSDDHLWKLVDFGKKCFKPVAVGQIFFK